MYACGIVVAESKRQNQISPAVEIPERMLPRLMNVSETILYPVTHDTDSQSAAIFYTRLVIRKMITQW
jgi:hypothetical protein